MARPYRVDRIWTGLKVVIIGGGPSLTLEQVHAIARARLAGGLRVIAVNNAVYVAWWADWLHACDATWWSAHIQAVQHYPGIRTTLDPTLPDQWHVGLLNNTGKFGFDENPVNCRTGGNSVYQAIHCAVHADAKDIILIGVDMKRDGRRTHWHPGHGGPDVDYATVMSPAFDTLKPALEDRRVKVVNASPGSALDAFPKVSLEHALQ